MLDIYSVSKYIYKNIKESSMLRIVLRQPYTLDVAEFLTKNCAASSTYP